MEPTSYTEPAGEGREGPALRLVWSNPNPPSRPARPMDLARAIERHLSGHDGLSEAEFLATFSGRSRLSPSPAPSLS